MTRYFITYYLVLIAFLVASFIPEHRIWGINWWAYYPNWVRWGLFGFGVIAPNATAFVFKRSSVDSTGPESAASRKGYYVVVGLLTTLFAVTFYVLRSRAHFLGDGYQLLSRLANDATTVKQWDRGMTFINNAVFGLLSGTPDGCALETFQIISISTGIVLLIAVGVLSRFLFQSTIQRVLFLLGLMSSGYMLLFFGYVENYSVMIALILIYSLLGLAVTKSTLPRYWTVVPFVIAVTLHIFALSLLPSLIYLLSNNTAWSRRWSGVLKQAIYPAAALLVVVGASVHYYLYTHYYFFTFALLPPFPDRFTVDNDWLFSLKHFVDIGNLLWLLLPGLPLLVVGIITGVDRQVLRRPAYRFLLILLLSTLGTVFIFNAGIGMPRNWDLFSIIGPPLAVAGYYLLLDNRRRIVHYRNVCILSILLGLLILLPRAASLAAPNVGVRHFRNYLLIDKTRGRTGYSFLIKFYKDRGDHVQAGLAASYWDDLYPQRKLLVRSEQAFLRGNTEEANKLCNRAHALDPLFYIPYYQLGSMYLEKQEPDSALAKFDIALGLNPYGADIVYGQAMAYAQKGDLARAEKAWITVTEWSDELIDAHLHLMDLYEERADGEQYLKQLVATGIRDDAPVRVIKELGDYRLAEGRYADAAICYRRALAKGLDSTYVRSLAKLHPQLVKYLK